MKRFWRWLVEVLLGFLMVTVAFIAECRAQSQPVHHVAVIGQAAELLTREWTPKVPQNERAYCISQWAVHGDTVTVSIAIPAHITRADWNTVNYVCPSGEPALHTHPFQECSSMGACMVPTWRAPNCDPSSIDEESLYKNSLEYGQPFQLIQCGATRYALFVPPLRQPYVRSEDVQ